MKKRTPAFSTPLAAAAQYQGTALIADPIHGYIPFTVPASSGTPASANGPSAEITEKDLIDSPWMQRLRLIYQLQSARWVFPSAEHSRFVHSLGAMHIAGRFARHLYPTLKEAVPETPSQPFVEELLRIAALFHDSGHGPFGHFFDDNFLNAYGITHEVVGQQIITRGVGNLIAKVRRSPNGDFAPGEEIDPAHAAFLIRKDPGPSAAGLPRWLTILQPLLSGVYTVDNLDYVLRDAYMCGVSTGPIDLSRLIHYTFFTPQGLTLHKAGGSALGMFLNARLYMYSNVYYHRTTRAIDLHLREIFRETIRSIFPHNPMTRLTEYRRLTDWSLLEEVRSWPRSRHPRRRRLGAEWSRILARNVKWRMAYDTTLSVRQAEKGRTVISHADLEEKVRKELPPSLRKLPFRVDMASQDPRPENPLMMGERQIYVFNPSTRKVSKEWLMDYFEHIPAKIVHCRVFALDHRHDAELAEITERVLRTDRASIGTNV